MCGTADELFSNIGIDMFKDIQPDFWIVANSIQRVDNYYEKFNRLNECNGILAFAIGVDPTMNLEKLLKIKYHCYNRASPTVSEEEVPLIQTYVQNYTKNGDSFGHWEDEILMYFKTLSDSAKNIGVAIINLAENSPLASVLKTFPALT